LFSVLFAVYLCNMVFFFFSSRRRHTRLQGDWSSDVCSSDLKKQGQPGEQRSLGWTGIGHGSSASGTRPLARVRILRWRRGSRRCGGNRARDVSDVGGQVACETDDSDHDKDHGKSIAKRKISAAKLVEKKQNADGDDDCRTHEAANHTAVAIATNAMTHRHASLDRKSTRLNSSHLVISYAVFCLKKKT